MKMLDLITLQVIEDIFDSTTKVKSLTKSIYINCILKHFKNKDASLENAMGFSFKISDIPSYPKFENNFKELHNVGIVNLTEQEVIFENKWGQLIDRTKLNLWSDGTGPMKRALEYEEDLRNNISMIDVICMKNRMSKSQVLNLIKIFILEQDATQTLHKDSGDVAKHFIYWVSTNLDKIQISKENVKSKSKILGLE